MHGEGVTLAKGDFICSDVEALRCFLSGFFLRPSTDPVMTIYILQTHEHRLIPSRIQYAPYQKLTDVGRYQLINN